MTQLDAKLIQHANISEWDLGVEYISEIVIAEHGYKNHVKDLAETFGPDFRLTDAGVREWAADHVISTDYGVCNFVDQVYDYVAGGYGAFNDGPTFPEIDLSMHPAYREVIALQRNSGMP